MKKIMFNDHYGLTQAVLEGRKTMTRRIINPEKIVQITTSDGVVHLVEKSAGSYLEYKDKDGKVWLAWSPFKVGDVVAVAQRYSDIYNEFSWLNLTKGWNNKMFVQALRMPHRIKITDIKVECLQDISNEDCLMEGITKTPVVSGHPTYSYYSGLEWDTPRDAFAALIDKVSGKGTWDSNPWVFAYEFELVK